MSYPDQAPQTAGSTLPFRTANDLPAETRQPVVQQLNQSLADTTDLGSQMKFAHWNVKGMQFYQLHLLFDEIAEVLAEHADTLAERATSLGGRAMGTVRMAAATSQLPELAESTVTGAAFVEETTEHLAIHAANLRAAIDVAAGYGDEDTADLYTELSREVDQQLYFLESHLQTGMGAAEQVGGMQPAGDTHQPEWTVQNHRRDSVRNQRQQPASRGQQRPQRATFTDATQQERQEMARAQRSSPDQHQLEPSTQ